MKPQFHTRSDNLEKHKKDIAARPAKEWLPVMMSGQGLYTSSAPRINLKPWTQVQTLITSPCPLERTSRKNAPCQVSTMTTRILSIYKGPQNNEGTQTVYEETGGATIKSTLSSLDSLHSRKPRHEAPTPSSLDSLQLPQERYEASKYPRSYNAQSSYRTLVGP